MRKPLGHLIVESKYFHVRADKGYANTDIINHTFIFFFTLEQFSARQHTFGYITKHLNKSDYPPMLILYRNHGVFCYKTWDYFFDKGLYLSGFYRFRCFASIAGIASFLGLAKYLRAHFIAVSSFNIVQGYSNFFLTIAIHVENLKVPIQIDYPHRDMFEHELKIMGSVIDVRESHHLISLVFPHP